MLSNSMHTAPHNQIDNENRDETNMQLELRRRGLD